MSDTLANLRRKIDGAVKLESVVRTMKAVAASSIGQYEAAVHALADYERSVQLGLSVCFRQSGFAPLISRSRSSAKIAGAIVFGSDQGLVGQFNETMADFVQKTLGAVPGDKKVWAVGERIYGRLADAGLAMAGQFAVPSSVNAITSLVGQLQIAVEAQESGCATIDVFYTKLASGAQYEPVNQRLLPLDAQWQKDLIKIRWPTKILPELCGSQEITLRAFIREYLFISLFKACAESLASENASRLAAMQRAEKNIDSLMTDLNRTFYRLRQSSIDEELFDVIAGFNALSHKERKA
ncbi:MAG: F0F1 ATP synthase subunit gamma [Methylacidiphilales bacterium]|nr:F0F1 ATP synthase subunit gamma [Candidatus Methylacidiphilales bacterium]